MANTLTKKRPGITFRAIPDTKQVGVIALKNGEPGYLWRNTLILPEALKEKLAKTSVSFMYPPPEPVDFKNVNWIVNMCTDADEYKHSLVGLDEAFGSKARIFNHPRSIAMSRRDISARLLEGIPNLIVPKCVAFKADQNDSFQKTFAKEGFTYPVLIRPATSQSGQDLVKIDHPFDWPKAYQSHWYRKQHFMTQFLDFKQDNGRYVKIRIAVIGEQIFLRAYGEDTQWIIGHPGKEEQKVPVSELWKTLAQKHDEFPLWEAANRVGHEIRKRAKLDFFGIDLGVINRETFVLFEANASMTMAEMPNFSPEDKKIAEKIFTRLEKALLDLFSEPSKWADGKAFPTCRSILGMLPETTVS